jgi:hypothetical protein
MDEKNTCVVKFSDGEVYLWVEAESSVMLKAITKSGDPAELEAEEARELGETLIKMAAQIE